MTKRTFSHASLVTTWVLLLAQNKPLVEALAKKKFEELKEKDILRLGRHLRNLVTHAMTLLTTGKVDTEAVKRAKQAHAAIDAFGAAKRDMSVFVLDSFALVTLVADLPQVPTFNLINTLATEHEAPIDAATLEREAERAIKTLIQLHMAGNTTGVTGAKVAMGALLSPEGQKTIQLGNEAQLSTACSVLLRRIANMADAWHMEHVIDDVAASLPG